MQNILSGGVGTMELWLVVIGYLLGSIPCSALAAQFYGGVDARNVGSGNVGAMNVLRNVGVVPGLVGGAGDVLKGVVAALLASWPGTRPWIPLATGLAAVAGHNWPLWYGLSGGKGLATSLGVMLVLFPKVVPWIVIAAVLSGLLLSDVMMGVAVGFGLAPVLLWLITKDPVAAVFGVGLAVLVIIRLRPDIRAFRTGRQEK